MLCAGADDVRAGPRDLCLELDRGLYRSSLVLDEYVCTRDVRSDGAGLPRPGWPLPRFPRDLLCPRSGLLCAGPLLLRSAGRGLVGPGPCSRDGAARSSV